MSRNRRSPKGLAIDAARYRKKATGGLDDTKLRTLEDRLTYLCELEQRRAAILKSIEEQGKLTPELAAALHEVNTKARLEDLYLPYKPKRRTKAQIAREAGLAPLAFNLLQNPVLVPEQAAASHVNEEKGVSFDYGSSSEDLKVCQTREFRMGEFSGTGKSCY